MSMAGFNDFDNDMMNDDDGFGSSDFGTDSGFDSSDSSFGDTSGGFEDSFNDDMNLPDVPNGNGSTKKTAIIAVIVGLIGIVGVVIVANMIANANKNSIAQNNSESTTVQTTASTSRVAQPVDDIMSSDREENKPSTQHSDINKYKNDDWILINANEVVDFDTDYKDMIFLVTDIQHYAKTVDTNGNLVIKTTLTGGLSGLTGSYELDVPYSKGTQLVVGDEFAVRVQFGTYHGKKVIGEIVY